jgi:hypothetical protein
MIAQSIHELWPDAEIRFMVSVEASYARSVPFETRVLRRSPTLEPEEVAQYIARTRPTLVVLDNAGRTSILKAAHAVGARVVFISSRSRQRGKAFRLGWMRLIDEHWIAYPASIAGALTWLERLKLAALRRPTVRFLDTFLPRAADPTAVVARLGLVPNDYVLFAPGGGSSHRSMPQAPDEIARGALGVARRSHRTLLLAIVPRNAGEMPSNLVLERTVPMPELVALIEHAKLVVCNGADTLLQVIALRRPCIAIPMSPDQEHRLAQLAGAGLAVSTRPVEAEIVTECERLLGDPAALSEREAAVKRVALRDGLPIALDAIRGLTGEAPQP